MGQVDFAYALAADSAGLPIAVSVFADRERVRGEMREDVELAGLLVRECGALGLAGDGGPAPLGEVVLADCPREEAAALAALTRLDARVARSGARLIVTASLESLEAVYACCSQSDAQILVAPLRAERVIALGRVLAGMPGLHVRELSEEDRLLMLRLTQQVTDIAQRLDGLTAGRAPDNAGEGFIFGAAPARGEDQSDRLVRATRPPLPDPRLVRKIIQQRQLRARFFDGDLFADPAWDMLLDLTAARVEHVRVSVTSLCIASGVPPTTALRWITQLSDVGLFERVEDETDRRRAFIQLTDRAVDAMARYFHELGKNAAGLV
jgi:Winged helix DNA-binding domain